jgi:hypothetical protein
MIREGPELRRIQANLVPKPLKLLGQSQQMDLGTTGTVKETVRQYKAHSNAS